jgi:formamidopyrimidine-DNA glycosylase
MPELPEVETTLRGIEPFLLNQVVDHIDVRESRLRWPVPETVAKAKGQIVESLARRGKYLLIQLQEGGLLLHLGMSGSLRISNQNQAFDKHDHLDIVLKNGSLLRFNDPRRFGALLWFTGDAAEHPLLKNLGPEPLSSDFDGDYLWQRSRGRRVAVKNFIMNGHIVVGVGNIYSSEALYMAGIHPARAAGRISRKRYQGLAGAIRDVLSRAIRQGGTTLRDFVSADGVPGYFAQELLVYGRNGLVCFQCRTIIRLVIIGKRSSYYCPRCQH